MSGIIKFSKVVNALPDPLEKNTIYFVKTGASVLAYVTNDLGLVVSYPLTVDLSTKADLLHSHDAATESVDGFMSATDKTKLNTVASGATANASDATLLNRANHTGSQATSTVTGLDAALAGKASTDVATTTVNGLMSSTDKTKLNGIAAGATANTGTVTSVTGTGTVAGLSLSGTVSASGNITLSGTLAVTPSNFSSQAANLILASPNGAAGVPTFRAIVASDIPTLNQNTTGSAGSVAWTGVTGKPGNATTSVDGFMSSADKTKLDGVASGATANTGTVTSVTGTGTVSGLSLSGTVSTTGNITLGGTLAVAASNFSSQTANTFLSAPNGAAGVPTFRTIVAADIPTLNQNTTGSAGSVAWAGVTGKPTNATTSVDGFMSATDKTKLNGVATGATANAADATLLDRANHTGSQAISTITNLQTSLDAKVTDGINIKRIHVGTTPPGDTTMLWIDTN